MESAPELPPREAADGAAGCQPLGGPHQLQNVLSGLSIAPFPKSSLPTSPGHYRNALLGRYLVLTGQTGVCSSLSSSI